MFRLAQFRITHILLGIVALLWSVFASSAIANARERFAIIIANKDYRFTDPVRYADRDGEAVEHMLGNVLRVPKSNIRVFNNASMADLRYIFGGSDRSGLISRFVQGDDSELIVYFAGHGSKEAERGGIQALPYLLGTDSRPDDLRGTAYSLNLLKEKLDELQRKELRSGRVTLILESCFSGRSHLGELLKDRSAPALSLPLSPPVERITHNDRLLIMAAAKSDQFATWDKERKHSVFTDALVTAMYGEADARQFGGDGNDVVSLEEARQFIRQRVARRVRLVLPGAEQEPEIRGGSANEILARKQDVITMWPELRERRLQEEWQANYLLHEEDLNKVRQYLRTCTYCYLKDKLRQSIGRREEQASRCKLEAKQAELLLREGNAAQIESFTPICTCCGQLKQKLIARAQQLRSTENQFSEAPVTALHVETGHEEVGDPTVTPEPRLDNAAPAKRQQYALFDDTIANVDPAPPGNVVRTLDPQVLAEELQTELKSRGCYTGKIDGKWGRGSRRAAQQFIAVAGLNLGTEATASLLTSLQERSSVLCKPDQSANRPNGTGTKRKSSSSQSRKSKTVKTATSRRRKERNATPRKRQRVIKRRQQIGPAIRPIPIRP